MGIASWAGSSWGSLFSPGLGVVVGGGGGLGEAEVSRDPLFQLPLAPHLLVV